MFAYCGNSPISRMDPSGHSYINICNRGFTSQFDILQDTYGGGGGGSAFCGSVLLTSWVIESIKNLWSGFISLFAQKSDSIDWGANNNLKNHIIKGTKGSHIGGWKRFGTDPNKSNQDNWLLILPILQETVDDADYYYQRSLASEGTLTFYVKTYIAEGVKIVVKIWESADGLIQEIADAIPYIIN